MTFSHLQDYFSNENCTIISIIHAVNTVALCAETLLVCKLDDKDELVNCFANIYAVFNEMLTL